MVPAFGCVHNFIIALKEQTAKSHTNFFSSVTLKLSFDFSLTLFYFCFLFKSCSFSIFYEPCWNICFGFQNQGENESSHSAVQEWPHWISGMKIDLIISSWEFPLHWQRHCPRHGGLGFWNSTQFFIRRLVSLHSWRRSLYWRFRFCSRLVVVVRIISIRLLYWDINVQQPINSFSIEKRQASRAMWQGGGAKIGQSALVVKCFLGLLWGVSCGTGMKLFPSGRSAFSTSLRNW